MYRTVAQLDSVMGTLAAFFPQLCQRVELPNRSHQGRPIYALRLRAGGGGNRRGVLIVGGMHARELMNPDAIVELQMDLVLSYLNQTGRSYGGAHWSALDIKVILETLDIWMLPCANPDGREYVITTDNLWRQNRRDNPGTECDGVDINRNCDFVWGVTGPNTSCSPCFNTYVGPDRFSEPESRNIEFLCDTHQINVFVDVHSFSELILHPWGHAPTQTADPSQRFMNLATGTCAPLNPPGHQEYMSPQDELRFRTVAERIADAIRAVRGRNYTRKSVYQIYAGATTGTCTDYVYSRHIANPGLQKTHGFAFETGPDTGNGLLASFQPTDPTPVKRDTKAGLLSLIQQSGCAIEFIGSTLLGTSVQAIRDVRDETLPATDGGRGWIDLFERVQFPLLGVVLSDPKLLREALSLLKRVQELTAKKDKARVSAKDVTRGLAFLEALEARGTADSVRNDLALVRRQLKKAGGQSLSVILKQLIRSKPAATKIRT